MTDEARRWTKEHAALLLLVGAAGLSAFAYLNRPTEPRDQTDAA